MSGGQVLAAKDNATPTSHPPARAKSVVLIYLQGGPPTQDMFDLKPERAGRRRRRVQADRHERAGHRGLRALPLTARWMHKSAIVRSVYHNGGCHKNLPMYTGYDVNLPDEEFRDSDPPSMGSVCAYLERDQQKRAADLRLSSLPARLGRGAQEGRAARRVSGPALRSVLHRMHGLRRSTRRTTSGSRRSCAASRAWPTPSCAEGITLDRLDGRRRLVEQFDEQFRAVEPQRDLGNFPARSSGWRSRCSLRPRSARPST